MVIPIQTEKVPKNFLLHYKAFFKTGERRLLYDWQVGNALMFQGTVRAALAEVITEDGTGTRVYKPLEQRANILARDIGDFQKFPDKSELPQKNFTLEEVSQCDGKEGRHLCIIFENNVYDVTDFADYHPAGPEPLKQHAGADATAAMRATRMPQHVFDVFMKRFLVGQVEDHKIATEREGSESNSRNSEEAPERVSTQLETGKTYDESCSVMGFCWWS